MGNIDNVLKKKIKQLGIERQVEAAGMVEKATAEIAKYIPKEDFEVISFKNGILKVSVKSSSAANELQLNSAEVIKNLEGKIKRVMIKQGS